MVKYGETLPEAMGRQLKAERAALGLTQDELGEKIGKDKQSIMRYEGGKRDIPLSTLGLLADVFGVTPQELMRRAVDRIQQ